MLKHYFLVIVFLFMTMLCCYSGPRSKSVKISVEPNTASIYINGTFSGYGIAEFIRPKKDEVIIIRIEAEEYKPITTKYYGNDKRPVISYTLQNDGFYRATAASGIVNRYFTIDIDKMYVSVDDTGEISIEKAWKKITQILLNYFDEISTSDFWGGYLQTPWQYKTFIQSDKLIRNRITIRDITTPVRAAFQIKIESEVAGASAAKHGEFTPMDRIPKELEPVIQELQSRIGKFNNI